MQYKLGNIAKTIIKCRLLSFIQFTFLSLRFKQGVVIDNNVLRSDNIMVMICTTINFAVNHLCLDRYCDGRKGAIEKCYSSFLLVTLQNFRLFITMKMNVQPSSSAALILGSRPFLISSFVLCFWIVFEKNSRKIMTCNITVTGC